MFVRCYVIQRLLFRFVARSHSGCLKLLTSIGFDNLAGLRVDQRDNVKQIRLAGLVALGFVDVSNLSCCSCSDN